VTAPALDVLLPTFRRPAALAVTLASLSAQTLPRFRVVVSDQTEDEDTAAAGEVQTAVRLLRARGRPVELHRHLPRRGLAEHRQFLLEQSRAPYALFLDDDVLCEPDLLARLLRVIGEQQCGFVGAPLVGLSHLDDVRPHQQAIELWDGPVQPETIEPDGPEWARHHLHSAANAWHVQEQLGATDERPVVYKVAWVGGCVLYDVAKLRDVGGFDFWTELPAEHCGEDVLAQLRVMERYGGCAVLPSGAYHQQLQTTVEDRAVDAPRVLRTRSPAPRPTHPAAATS
jgi:GT2 family glycosyltransferase